MFVRSFTANPELPALVQETAGALSQSLPATVEAPIDRPCKILS